VVNKLAGFRMSQDARYRWHQTVLECPTGVVPLQGHGKQSSKLLLVLGGKKIIEGPSASRLWCVIFDLETSVVRRIWSRNLVNEEALAHWGAVALKTSETKTYARNGFCRGLMRMYKDW